MPLSYSILILPLEYDHSYFSTNYGKFLAVIPLNIASILPLCSLISECLLDVCWTSIVYPHSCICISLCCILISSDLSSTLLILYSAVSNLLINLLLEVFKNYSLNEVKNCSGGNSGVPNGKKTILVE